MYIQYQVLISMYTSFLKLELERIFAFSKAALYCNTNDKE